MGARELPSEVVLKPVVVEERVVDVEQKDGLGRGAHGDVPRLRSALSALIMPSARGPQRSSRAALFPVRRPGVLDDRERVHAIHPGRKTRADEVVLDEIRTPAGDPHEERHEWIDGEVDRREIAGQIVAGRGALPQRKLLAGVPSPSLPRLGRSRNACRRRRDSRRPRAPSAAGSRACAVHERKAPGRSAIGPRYTRRWPQIRRGRNRRRPAPEPAGAD